MARRDGLYGTPRHAPLASRRTGARHRERGDRAPGLLAGRGARGRRGPRRSRRSPTSPATPLGRDYHKVLRARLQALADRMVGGAGRLPLPRLHRQRPGDGSGARRARGAGLARQAHAAPRARRRLAVLPRRALRGPGPREGRAGEPATAAPASAASTPARRAPSWRPTSSTRAAASPTSPSRTPARSRRSSAPRSATASTAATTASSPARGTSTRARPAVPDFAARNGLDAATLVDLFAWTREEFESRLEGSAIRRIGHARWLRNIAVALGNAPASPEVARRAARARGRPRPARARARRLGPGPAGWLSAPGSAQALRGRAAPGCPGPSRCAASQAAASAAGSGGLAR